jgi:hypothetical protein
MNHSIAQKILLVIVLVTIMDGGTLAESGSRAAKPGAIQKSGPLINGMTTAMTGRWQLTLGSNCPYHGNLSHKNVLASRVSSN